MNNGFLVIMFVFIWIFVLGCSWCVMWVVLLGFLSLEMGFLGEVFVWGEGSWSECGDLVLRGGVEEGMEMIFRGGVWEGCIVIVFVVFELLSVWLW